MMGCLLSGYPSVGSFPVGCLCMVAKKISGLGMGATWKDLERKKNITARVFYWCLSKVGEKIWKDQA